MSDVSFADLGVPPVLADRLSDRGIASPFPIQAACIPDALAGRDICGRAPTGSGKTIAFGIPLVVRLMKDNRKDRGRAARGLVLVPTRELAAQVHRELIELSPPNGPWAEPIYGGVGFDKQLSAARRGLDIIVACPGRLGDLINQGRIRLDEIEMVVIDEADRMADMGFLPEVRRLLDQCTSDRQTLLFSATLDGDVNTLIKQYQDNPARYELDADERVDARADHHFWSVDVHSRVQTTAGIVDRAGPTVVFTRTKHGADRVAKQLDQHGVRAAAIHGGRSQSQRDRALQSFHLGDVAALVATDVAARGIHVDNVAAVVHFDPPADHKDYVHRSGRTARAGNAGVVVSLVTSEVRKQVSGLQKKLELPRAVGAVDLEGLPEGAPFVRPPRRPEPRPERREKTHSDRRPSRESSRGSARSGSGDRPERPRFERNDRPARDERPARKEWTTDRPNSDERPARQEWTDRPARADRPARDERPARKEWTDRPARADQPTRPSWNDRNDGPARVKHNDRPARDERPARPARDDDWAPATTRPVERTRDERPAASRPELQGTPEGGSTADEKRRLSGAARRKAKKEAIAEAERLGIDTTTETWATPDADRGSASGPRRNSSKPVTTTGRGKPKPSAKAKAKAKAKAEMTTTAGRTRTKAKVGSGSSYGSGAGKGKHAGRAPAATRSGGSSSGSGRRG